MPAQCCSAGIATASTSRRTCRCCPPIWGTAGRLAPTGISRRSQSYWPWPRSDATSFGGCQHDRAGSDPRGVLHSAADGPAPLQPQHRRCLQGLLAAVAAIRQRPNRQAAVPTGPGRPRCGCHQWVLGPLGNRAPQQHPHPQCPSGGPAIRSFFHYAALRHPEHADLIARVLAIPTKHCQQREVCWLDRPELEALVDAPDPNTWTGRRDHALLDVAAQTGLRVSELTGLRNQDIELGKGAHVRCNGKGRKERATPLPKETVTVLKSWTKERRGEPDDPLFPTRRGTPLSRRAVEDLVAKHAATATNQCPSLETKHPTPHAIRHGCAMELLRSKVDISVIALWLGHERPETTHRMYIHGDLSIKERALP